jgi:hypothetical protein
MPLTADRVRETTTTTGTGALTLAGAAAGYQTFSAAFASGTEVYYTITDGTGWEVGRGTFTTTLSRDVVLQSTNSDALVNWGAGTKDVFVTAPAQVVNSMGAAWPQQVWAMYQGDSTFGVL